MSESGWEDIRQSTHGEEIWRYKTDIEALDVIIRSVNGLATEIFPFHIDLKSRSLIVILKTKLMPPLEALRQQLPAVSDVYAGVLTPVSGRYSGAIVISVNTQQFIRQSEAATQVMVDLKSKLMHIHQLLDQWFVQEYQNITLLEDHPEGQRDWSETWKFLEREIWEKYTTAYTALMSGTSEPAAAAHSSSSTGPTPPQQTHLAPLLRRMRDFDI